MGWERKRGKIEEFNRLLRGATDTSFAVQVGDLSDPARRALLHHARQRYPPAARCGAAADRHHHPPAESRGRSIRNCGRVVEGYGILQPRISVTYMSAAGSLFARLYSGHTGVDPYTTAVSDTYQDLFGEGIFTGKGLYDVDAFTAALEDSVPENALLSHDLFEGLHARVALVSDVELVDEYPVERPHARAAAASLDPRRLADPVLAVPVRAVAARAEAQHRCRSSAAGRFSTTCGAAWSRRRCCSLAVAGMDDPAGLAAGSGPATVIGVLASQLLPLVGAAAHRAPAIAVLPGVLPQSVARCDDRAGADSSSA